MKLAVMQPYLFPYLGYYQLIHSVDKFVVYDDVSFIKQGWINRNNILLNNKKYLFFAPVKGISSFKKINETEIDYKYDWIKKTLQTMEQAYKKAPEFKNVYPIIENVLNKKSDLISTLATESLIEVCNYLDIKTEIQKTSCNYNNENLKGQDRVIDICKKENAHEYINPIGGQELYSKEEFKINNLTLNFINMNPINYKQYNEIHIPYLSIIDVLMFNDKLSVNKFITSYNLI